MTLLNENLFNYWLKKKGFQNPKIFLSIRISLLPNLLLVHDNGDILTRTNDSDHGSDGGDWLWQYMDVSVSGGL